MRIDERENALLEQAATAARARLQRDQRQVTDYRYRLILSHLAERLFDEELMLKDIYASLKIRDHSIGMCFRQQLGEPPNDYLRHRRLETSGHLLSQTRIPVYAAGEWVGFKSNHSFGVAFKRWSGVSPGNFRRRARALTAIAASSRLDPQPIAAAFGSGLKPAAQHTLLTWLSTAHPELTPLVPPLPESATAFCRKTVPLEVPLPDDLLDPAIHEELPKVSRLWRRLHDRPASEQLELIYAKARDFKTPALFLWLREASRLAAREDPERGLELARLALVGAKVIQLEQYGDGRSELEAMAWTWLAYRLSYQYDFPGSEQAFSAAEVRMPKGANALVTGDFCYRKGEFRWRERHFDEALELIERAIELFKKGKSKRLHAEALILRGIVQSFRKRIPAAIADLEQGISLLPKGYGFQLYSAYFNLARCYCELDSWDKAWALLPKLRNFVGGIGTLNELLLQRLEARVLANRGQTDLALNKLVACRMGLKELRLFEHAAVAALDLAVLYTRKKELDKAALVATDAVPLFLRLQDRGDARNALKLVKEGSRALVLEEDAAREARRCLGALLDADPGLRLDEPLARVVQQQSLL